MRAPIEAGQPVGVVESGAALKVAMEAPVYAAEKIGPVSTMRRAIDGASELVIGMFRAGAEALRWPKSPSNHHPCAGGFITFEGGEGSGKSAQVLQARQSGWMHGENLHAPSLRLRPGGSPSAEIIRHLVLSGMGKLLGPGAETLLFARHATTMSAR